MKGKNFLKVTGILMIIGGAIGAILGLISLIGSIGLAALLAGTGYGFWLIVGSILALAGGAAQLVAGIFGVSHCENPQKAPVCLRWGIIVAALCILSNIFTVIGGGSFSFFSLILGLIIPALYIYGAVQNKNAA